MCLITVSTAARIRKEMLTNGGMIESIFHYNSDGLGAMYRNKRGLRVVKILPRDIKDCIDFFASMPNDDRALAVHWRMKTHGAVNLANCHPYDVVPGRLAMMHNGVLATGNAADPTRSDTWHFIQDYLADACAQAPGIVHTGGFQEMCGEFINNNRFVFMDDSGKVSIVNKDQGTVHDGIWFANEYAWEPSSFIPGYRSKVKWYSGFSGLSHDDDDSWAAYYRSRNGSAAPASTQLTHYSDKFDANELIDFVHSADAPEVEKILIDYPHRGVAALVGTHRAHVTKSVQNSGGIEKAISGKALEAVKACLGGQLQALQTLAMQHPGAVSEAICYYLDWDALDKDEDEDGTPEPSARYKGMQIFVMQKANDRYGYVTMDPKGSVWSQDDGYATAESARDEAIFEIRQFEGGSQLPTAEASEIDADVEAALDRQFVEALTAERDIV